MDIREEVNSALEAVSNRRSPRGSDGGMESEDESDGVHGSDASRSLDFRSVMFGFAIGEMAWFAIALGLTKLGNMENRRKELAIQRILIDNPAPIAGRRMSLPEFGV